MKTEFLITKLTVFLCLTLIASIYLFVTAPPPLSSLNKRSTTIPLKRALEIINQENNNIRKLYTSQIVLKGLKTGLKFDENWEDENIEAGLLPAQFLRATAVSLEKSPEPLGLYLGSDFPVNDSNLLTGLQLKKFKLIKDSKTPQFFFVSDIQRFTYMFADVAVSKACVTCHNDHKDTPKSDWKLNEVMGATTWTYPDEFIDYETFIKTLDALRKGFSYAYENYVEKIRHIKNPPVIGNKWPRDGYFVPSLEVFNTEVSRINSPGTFAAIVRFDDPTIDKRSTSHKEFSQ